MIDADSLDIVCTAIGRGREHDFKIYRKSKVHCLDQVSIIADRGYQGICKLHRNSHHPIKASPKHKLSICEKKYNIEISRCRIAIEHVNRYIKRFRILSGRYRNRNKRFGLRVNLISAIYNI